MRKCGQNGRKRRIPGMERCGCLRNCYLGSLLELVFQQADFDAGADGAFFLVGVAHPDHVDAVWALPCPTLEITFDRICHLSWSWHEKSVSPAGGEALHLNNVTVLTVDLSC